MNLTQLSNIEQITGGIEPIFEFIRNILTSIAGFIRSIVIQYFPQYESIILLLIAFVGGYFIGKKSPVPTWILIGIILFLILRYI